MPATNLSNSRVTQVVCPSIVGRDSEWAELVQCLDESAVGRGGLVAVVGEVGIGKTRLARDLADHARSAGMWVLVGRAVETGAATPFRALFEALSGYFRQAGTDAHPELERRRSRRCWCPSGVCRGKTVPRVADGAGRSARSAPHRHRRRDGVRDCGNPRRVGSDPSLRER